MEACGSAHHWARRLTGQGIEVRLLPAAYLRAYVKRNKTDAADACALLDAAPLRQHSTGAHQVGRAASTAGAAPHPLALDEHPNLTPQCLGRHHAKKQRLSMAA